MWNVKSRILSPRCIVNPLKTCSIEAQQTYIMIYIVYETIHDVCAKKGLKHEYPPAIQVI